KSHRATLSPAGASISAALPPGLGLVLSFPRQLSSAWTSTPIGGGASGLDDDRDVGMAQDLLGVGHDDGAGAALLVGHVRAREQRVAVGPLDHARHHLARLSRLDVRSEEHTSELQSRFDLVCRLLLEKK